jgi:hypothetical protein
MRYAIEGINRRTRVKKFQEVHAASEAEAVQLAGQGGLAVKKIYRVPDNAPPIGSAPRPHSTAGNSVPLSSALCYLLGMLAIVAGAVAPFLGLAPLSLGVITLGVLFWIAGALFHIVKLLKR